jgi:uncharacterized integral membrane protein
MKTIGTWLILAPLCALVLIFALLNRHNVSLELNPFNTDLPALHYEMPLFLLLFIAFAAGCLVGAAIHWLGQSQQRQRARALRAENEHLKQRLNHLPHLPDM